ncbi:MAG: electron transfer flavoprotein beta subunit/FixA family protein [Actinophytocola sp.]|nr:electron transfer flavoprotein beta subunit/FixA family protein [Actinophytocola sp.]
MEVLVCVKRVPAPGAKVPLTEDAQDIDTRHLGFTIGPHEECAVEEAVRLVEAHGGHVTVLAAGPPEVAEQLRYALAMGADRGVLVDTGAAELDPEATAAAVVHAIRTLDAEPFDLVLFGNESADAGHYQVGIRVACELGLPIVGGIKGIDVDGAAGDRLRLRRDVATGVEVYEVPLPTAAAVKEGLNLPRYPTMPGRLKARKAQLLTIPFEPAAGGLRKVRLRQPHDDREAAIVLGHGAAAAPAVVDVLEELGAV